MVAVPKVLSEFLRNRIVSLFQRERECTSCLSMCTSSKKE